MPLKSKSKKMALNTSKKKGKAGKKRPPPVYSDTEVTTEA